MRIPLSWQELRLWNLKKKLGLRLRRSGPGQEPRLQGLRFRTPVKDDPGTVDGMGLGSAPWHRFVDEDPKNRILAAAHVPT